MLRLARRLWRRWRPVEPYVGTRSNEEIDGMEDGT